MRLSYRGASYEYTPPTLEVTESEILGKYRGQPWKRQTLQAVPEQPVQELKYRNVAYVTDRAGKVRTIAQSTSLPVVEPVVRPVTNQPLRPISAVNVFRRNRTDWAEVHRHNLMQNLEHRIQVAKARGDQNLVNQLETEMRHLA